jgi:hypothetical protein
MHALLPEPETFSQIMHALMPEPETFSKKKHALLLPNGLTLI